jgi:hypothetical protein
VSAKRHFFSPFYRHYFLSINFAVRCSQKSRKFGIRHGIFPGEDKPLPELDPTTNNAGKLYHYRVTISPPTNFLVKVSENRRCRDTT